MAGIILFEEVYCCAECAKEGLNDMPDVPGEVTLHDPQYVVDREEIGLDSQTVDITRKGPESARTKIEQIDELFSGVYRVTPDNL